MQGRVLLNVSRVSFLIGASLIVLSIILSIVNNPVFAQDQEGSVLSITSACSGDCSTISIQVCNIGNQDLYETPMYNIWYDEVGEPRFGTVVYTGNVPALPAGECITLTFVPNGSGNYQFQAFQPSGYPGQGDIWSTVCEISCPIPTDVPTEIPTEIPTDVPTELPTPAPTEVPTVEPLILLISPSCVNHLVEWTIQNMNFSDVEFYYRMDLPEPFEIPNNAMGQPLLIPGSQTMMFTVSDDGPHTVTIFWYEGETVQTLSSTINSGFCQNIQSTEEPTQSPPGVVPPLEIPDNGSDNTEQAQILIPVTGIVTIVEQTQNKGYTERTIFNFGLICFGIGIFSQGLSRNVKNNQETPSRKKK
jgi:hypothetical protein